MPSEEEIEKYLNRKIKIEYPLPLKNITIRLRRGGGLEACHHELIIHGNGVGIYKRGIGRKWIFIQKGKIPQSQIFALFQHAIEIGFFEMKCWYPSNLYELDKKGIIQCCESIVCDYPSCSIAIKIGKQWKGVNDYLGGAPKRFVKFAKMIYRVYKPEKWIKLKELTQSQLKNVFIEESKRI